MKLALECPTYLLKDIQPLADMDWILTHLVLQDEAYAKFYRESNNFQILDNSVNELLDPCSLEDMKKANEVLGGVDVIVPPDYLGDHLSTEKALDKAVEVFGIDKILPVVQGHELRYVMECAEYFKKLGFTGIAVPYDITCNRTDSREVMASRRGEVIDPLVAEYDFYDIHLLGMTTIEELKTYQDTEQVKSIDTGVPIVYGMNCMHLDEPWNFKKDKPTMSQMEGFREFIDEGSTRHALGPSDKLSAIFWNIAYLRKVISGT